MGTTKATEEVLERINELEQMLKDLYESGWLTLTKKNEDILLLRKARAEIAEVSKA